LFQSVQEPARQINIQSNAVVKPIHPKVMPVILRLNDWLKADAIK